MAAAVISVPANEGISVKNENDDPEINAMALKMKETFQKTASRQQEPTAANVYINRAGRPVPLNAVAMSSPNALQKNQEKSKDAEDSDSSIGKFGWHNIGAHAVPYIMRLISGECLKFVSVRVAETQLLSNYLHYLHADIYTCTSVRSHFITDSEAKILNEINHKHSDQIYGKEPFIAGKDCIVRLEDVYEFYMFIEVCYKRLLSNFTPGRREKCGFIRINSESVVPYCIKDDKKYVPLFYFEGETDNLRHQAIKLENWNLAYLKFCCKVQGIRNELFASDSCIVTSLDDIKSYFPPETNFEEYWPAKVVDQQLLTNQKSSHVNPPGSWIKTPCTGLNKAPVPENIVQHPPLPPPQPAVVPPSIPMGMSSYQNGWPSNQMVNSYITQPPQPPPPTRGYSAPSRNQNIAAQYYNVNSAVLQQNSSSNPMNIQPPPLVRSGIPTTQVVSNNPVSYPNVASMNQPMTTMYNALANSGNVMSSHVNHMRQFYGSQRSTSSSLMPHHQQQQQQQLQQHAQQQQQMIASAQAQQQYGGPPMTNGGGVVGSNARITNTQQRNALRTAMTLPASEIIDLSSPPSSPGPLSQPSDSVSVSPPWDLKRIAERQWGSSESAHNIAYKIQKATLQGKIIHCINAKAFMYSDLMVTLEDLVQALFPTSTVARCAEVLTKYLSTTLYRGNSEQIAVLRENNRLRSNYAEETPMAMLQDITHVLMQLKALVSKHDEQMQQYHLSTGSGPAKRQRTS